jgi:Phage conserved hypothetical protein BR0599
MSSTLLDHHYLFTIQLEDGEELKLTSASHTIRYTNAQKTQTYEPSCLNVKFATFKDDGTLRIILEGIYEKTGIHQKLQLLGCTIFVKTFNPKNSETKDLALCSCYKIEDFVRSFRIHLESRSQDMRQIFSKKYSRNCRAQFGDERCKKDLKQLAQYYDILEMYESEVSFLVPLKQRLCENHYFDLGTATVGEISRTVLRHTLGKVKRGIDHQNGVVLLQRPLPEIVLQNFKDKKVTTIVLTPGCNKLFSTCAVYNNTINFQGEPFLPL